jgi:hypothetical protein
MDYTLQFAWHTSDTKDKLITLKIPPGPDPTPAVEVHPYALSVPQLHELMLAALACERVIATQLPNLQPKDN